MYFLPSIPLLIASSLLDEHLDRRFGALGKTAAMNLAAIGRLQCLASTLLYGSRSVRVKRCGTRHHKYPVCHSHDGTRLTWQVASRARDRRVKDDPDAAGGGPRWLRYHRRRVPLRTFRPTVRASERGSPALFLRTLQCLGPPPIPAQMTGFGRCQSAKHGES